MKPRLLFISPIVPSPDGPGLAMRPYYQIANLSQIYSIHLLVAGYSPISTTNTAHIKPFCERIDYLYRYRYSGWKLRQWNRCRRFMDYFRHLFNGHDLSFALDSADRQYLRHNKTLATIARMNFDRVHVFRIYLDSIAEILKEHGLQSFYSLDIDDIESETRRSISGLFSLNRNFVNAFKFNNESITYFNLETKSIPAYDQIFTCSHHDRDMLQNRFPDKVITALPNVVSIPEISLNHKSDHKFTILFVGMMDYYPNTDAIIFFAERIAPILREKSSQPWHLRVVGTPPRKKWMRSLKDFPEIKLSGFVKDLKPEYEAAGIVIVPIRGGGGTRIKILEAFTHGIPVVSTSKGAEGLEVKNGVHLFIEDDPDLFADACIRLMNDHQLRDEISHRAFSLAVSKYSPEIINHIWTETLSETYRS